MGLKSKIHTYLNIIKEQGFSGSVQVLKNKITRGRFDNYRYYQNLFRNKAGIEIGGPSIYFNNEIPIYEVVNSCDGVNFNANTVWEGTIKEGKNYNFNGKILGYQFIKEATELSDIGSNSYDFVLSCNNLEHIANPLKAVEEWLRVLKPGGLLLLVLPNKLHNFDHNRSFTTFEHILSDHKNNVTEEDLTHLEEILKLHDLELDKPAGSFESFKTRSLKNIENRCLHHHVYNLELLSMIYRHYNVQVLDTRETERDFVIFGKKQ